MEHQKNKMNSSLYRMDYYEQMANVAIEVDRAFSKRKADQESAAGCCITLAVKFLNTMLDDPKNLERKDVIRRDIAVLENHFFGKNLQHNDEETIRSYFKYFEQDHMIEFGRRELDAAMMLAAEFYQKKRDKLRNNYILHPIRVMLQMEEPEEKTVALLHDILNETDCTMGDLQNAGIYGYAIKEIMLLSGERGETYSQYIEKIKASEIARKVKIADLQEHLKEECPEECRKQYEETLRLLLDNNS